MNFNFIDKMAENIIEINITSGLDALFKQENLFALTREFIEAVTLKLY